jgi:hypothetical protein
MPREVIVYRGWIGGKESDRAGLERLGIDLGSYNKDVETFDGCEASEKAFQLLRKQQGKRSWGMLPRRKLVYDRTDADDEDIPF